MVSLERLEEVRASILKDDGQNVSSSLLKPCPFCGCEHNTGRMDEYSGPYIQVTPGYGHKWTMHEARVVCNTCHVSTTRSWQTSYMVQATDEDVTRLAAIALAIADWNRRAL